MQILVVGLNHKAAPVSLLERLVIGEDDLIKALHQLDNYQHVLEGAILSTCNRTEVYAVVSKFHGGAQDLRNFLSEFCHVAPEEFSDHLYTYHEEAAAGHLFRVAAGVDSLVVGESEILGQVRRAFSIAIDEGVARSVLSGAYRSALTAGRRARTETGIGRNPASVSTAAVELARRSFPEPGFQGKVVVLVGAGKMGSLAAKALARHGAEDVVVVNRTEERGRRLAEEFGARCLTLERLGEAISGADIVLCSTTSPETVIDRDLVEASMRTRHPQRTLMFVDIAVPRAVEPEVADVPGVVLRDIDDLHSVLEHTTVSRRAEASAVEEIVAGELKRFTAWAKAIEVAPTLAALVRKGEEIRVSELDRAGTDLARLSEAEAAAVEQVTRRIVAKLLHEPLETARNLASSESGHPYISALRDLFDLDD